MSRDGEPVDLRWDGRPEFWLVRGHVAETEACDWARDWCEGYDEPLPDRGLVVRHEWARWSIAAPNEVPDGCDRVLRLYRGAGPGRFKVTVAYDADELHRVAEDRREREEAETRVRAAVAQRYPEAEVLEVGRYGVDGYPHGSTWTAWGARLRFPGSQGFVLWQEGVPFVTVERRDLEAWNAYVDRLDAGKEAAVG